MVSETALQPLTPTLKSSRESPIRNMYKFTSRGVIRRNMEKNVKLKPKLTNIVLVNSLQRTSFKHNERKPVKKNWSPVSCTTGISIKPLTEEVVVDK